MKFRHDTLEANGTVGFVTWTDLSWDDIPHSSGRLRRCQGVRLARLELTSSESHNRP